jgi:hypothetical protein
MTERTYNRLLPKVGRQLPASDREQAKVYRSERDALRNENAQLRARLAQLAACPKCATAGDPWTDEMHQRGAHAPRTAPKETR